MRKNYDFSQGKRGAVAPSTGKTRITIMLDNDVLAYFRERAETGGTGYQTLVNAALREVIDRNGDSDSDQPLTVSRLREVLREELPAAVRKS